MTENPAMDNNGMLTEQAQPGFVKTWWVAMRPFALPASTMPVVFGTVVAITLGGAEFSLPAFLGAFFGMAFLHTGANLLNDVYDYKKGLDSRVNPVSGAVVRGWVSPGQALLAGWLFLGLGSAIGGLLVAYVGLSILWIGIAGVAIGVFYSFGPFELKFHALGDLAVFGNFAILGSLGAWTVQTGYVSWVPAVWAVPMGLLVAAILHANNWRDIKSDKSGGVSTVAGLLGDRGSLYYYGFLLFAPYAFVCVWTMISFFSSGSVFMPIESLLVLISFPLAVKLFKKGVQRKNSTNPLDFLALDGATAQLNMVFGVLYTASFGLDSLVRWLVA